MATKICTKCKVEKDFDQFSKHPRGKFGLQPRCKECQKDYSTQYYQQNKQKWAEYTAAERTTDPEGFKRRQREAQARYRANPENTIKLRYLKWRYDLSVEDYLAMEKAQEGLCKICGRSPEGRSRWGASRRGS